MKYVYKIVIFLLLFSCIIQPMKTDSTLATRINCAERDIGYYDQFTASVLPQCYNSNCSSPHACLEHHNKIKAEKKSRIKNMGDLDSPVKSEKSLLKMAHEFVSDFTAHVSGELKHHYVNKPIEHYQTLKNNFDRNTVPEINDFLGKVSNTIDMAKDPRTNFMDALGLEEIAEKTLTIQSIPVEKNCVDNKIVKNFTLNGKNNSPMKNVFLSILLDSYDTNDAFEKNKKILLKPIKTINQHNQHSLYNALIRGNVYVTQQEHILSATNAGLESVNDYGHSFIPNWYNLTQLNLRDNGIKKVEFSRILRASPNLTHISLENNCLTGVTPQDIKSLANASSIVDVNLSYNNINAVADTASLKWRRNQNNALTIHLNNNSLSANNVERILKGVELTTTENIYTQSRPYIYLGVRSAAGMTTAWLLNNALIDSFSKILVRPLVDNNFPELYKNVAKIAGSGLITALTLPLDYRTGYAISYLTETSFHAYINSKKNMPLEKELCHKINTLIKDSLGSIANPLTMYEKWNNSAVQDKRNIILKAVKILHDPSTLTPDKTPHFFKQWLSCLPERMAPCTAKIIQYIPKTEAELRKAESVACIGANALGALNTFVSCALFDLAVRSSGYGYLEKRYQPTTIHTAHQRAYPLPLVHPISQQEI